MNPLEILLVAFGLMFLSLVILLVLIRGKSSTKRLIEDLGLARHIWVSWLLVPLFRIYFWLLEKCKKLIIEVNAPIPWTEKILIFVANHQMPKMQDVFLLAVIIFFLRPLNFLNPIRYFPRSTADEANFVNSWFFRVIGARSLISVNRSSNRKRYRESVLEPIKQQLEEQGGGILIFYLEKGRTQTAIRRGIFTTRKSSSGEELKLGRLAMGAAELASEMNAPIIPCWGRIEGDNSYPKASPLVVIRGLVELLFIPGRRAYIDINHPSGPLRPHLGQETPKELTQRIENALFEIGDHQSIRLRKGKR